MILVQDIDPTKSTTAKTPEETLRIGLGLNGD